MLSHKHNQIFVNAQFDLGDRKTFAEDMLKIFFRGTYKTHDWFLYFMITSNVYKTHDWLPLFHDHF